MATVLIVAYLLIVIAMIVVILLQRSEGGGLGMGGGGGGGGFMSARGSANLLTRTTAILGTLFMVTAIGLTILSQTDNRSSSILSQAAQNPDGSQTTVLDALDALGGGNGDLNVPAQPATEGSDVVAPAAEPSETDVTAPAPVVDEPVAPSTTTPAVEPDAVAPAEPAVSAPEAEAAPADEAPQTAPGTTTGN
ncbi:preprotein translocase subunit SecG [Pelagibacterium luteolum]|uniref:Protein-export membrane protein SecG n=1 Tax=Pelagibacterium luteolum TaxID=440168 RepID=A0A1G7X0H8_9HYPH|nr:preprotein translocase subunit SecG [Pelagibacterium luteolum]SDG77703.1 preprotein translocase subunit SecG [Pelagibacterium luteolum]